jgi:hypothetical protein
MTLVGQNEPSTRQLGVPKVGSCCTIHRLVRWAVTLQCRPNMPWSEEVVDSARSSPHSVVARNQSLSL